MKTKPEPVGCTFSVASAISQWLDVNGQSYECCSCIVCLLLLCESSLSLSVCLCVCVCVCAGVCVWVGGGAAGSVSACFMKITNR